jgi:hypothetical protein
MNWLWMGENALSLDGFTGSDIHSSCKLFVENDLKAKMNTQKEENSRPLLRELVTRVDGHPLSLKLHNNAADLLKYLDKSLKDIIHEPCEIEGFYISEVFLRACRKGYESM